MCFENLHKSPVAPRRSVNSWRPKQTTRIAHRASFVGITPWVNIGSGYRASMVCWDVAGGARLFSWAPGGDDYRSMSIRPSYTTKVRRRNSTTKISLTLEQPEFELLRSIVGALSRQQYMVRSGSRPKLPSFLRVYRRINDEFQGCGVFL